MGSVTEVQVKKNAAFAVAARHPWLRSDSVQKVDGALEVGSVVDVHDPDGKWLARGLSNPESFLRIRLYQWGQKQEFGPSFWEKRFSEAIQTREMLGLMNVQEGCRVVFSEADRLSGVIVDRYANHYVMNLTAAVTSKMADQLGQAFLNALGIRSVDSLLVQTDKNMLSAESMEYQSAVISGSLPEEEIEIQENGVKFLVNLSHGQKTGFYLDQRDNRGLVGKLAFGDVLDVCCYTGGFALNAAKNPLVKTVTAVDVSLPALELAEKNRLHNSLPEVDFVKSDCFSFLDHIKGEDRKFDTVILDPPKFAGRKQEVPSALRAYHRLNYQAISQIRPGGILVTCSCSGRVSSEEFYKAILGAAKRSKRDVQILEARGPSPDHPVLFACPETAYLKCLICRVF